MAEVELVIFDCDGVLMDSEIVAARAELEIYKEYGIEMEPSEFAERFAGLNSGAIVKLIEEELGHALPHNTLEKTKALVDEKCMAEAQMVRGADTMLDNLDQARCICSNSPQERLKAMLSRTGLYDRFRPYVFSAKDFDPPRHKPLPDVFEKALHELECAHDRAVVLEDSTTGVEAARRAGLRVIGFTGASHSWPGHADNLIEAGAETVISRLADLPSVVTAFGEWAGLR